MQELRLTKTGRELLNKVINNKITFTSMALGKGVLGLWDEKQISLLDTVMKEYVTDVVIDKNNQITFKATFSNEKLKEGFDINEIGVFAQGIEDTEILFAYTNSYSQKTDYFELGVGNKIVKVIIDITMGFTDDVEINLMIDPNKNYATKDELVIATKEQVGFVKPTNDLTIEEDGALGINTVFRQVAERANIESGDTWETVLAKINKHFADVKPHPF